ncbi:MAG: hypothetical protein ACM3SY_18530 [Candidatus Omnitrophota bacterium]
MTPGIIIFLMVVVLMFFIIIGSIIKRRMKLKNANMKQQGFIPSGSEEQGQYQGISYAYKHYPGSKNSPPSFMVVINCPSPSTGAFKVTRETGFDRFCKHLGLCVELNTNDPEFDDMFYITTNMLYFTRQYLDDAEKRRLIRNIFDKGFNEVKFEGQTITATWHSFPRGNTMDIKTVEEIVAALSGMSTNIPYATEPEAAPWKSKRVFAFAIPILLLVTGVICLIVGLSSYLPLDTGKVFMDSLKYSVPLWIIFVWMAIQLLKGRSSSHREALAVFILSIFAFSIGSFGIETTLNGVMDAQSPCTHVVNVMEKYSVRGKHSYSYYAVVRSWRAGESTEKLKIHKSLYHDLNPGISKMGITTKPGHFGFEWLVNYSNNSQY